MSQDAAQVVLTYVPTPEEYQATAHQRVVYMVAQEMVKIAIQTHGLETGLSMVMSGLTREMRRHLSVKEIQSLLHGLADSVVEVAKYDT